MAVLRCTVCGGELEVNTDVSVGVCKFCDSMITIPKELDRKGNLYNRANFLRQNNEFDKAVSTYEDILKEDNGDAEAHWGLVLSKFGIEYITDPKTQNKIPTCHRMQSATILSDPDYLAAIEYSDIEAKRVIEKEAKSIHEIQAKILEISHKEPPYDIFICYKESDNFGNRTEDSTLAQDLYYELTKKGYKVFFARKTLERKLGTEYEPIIFAALNSARVMIVLGTKPEYFNAVWVRNEWSRFLKMSKNTRKVIIPAYRGMSPYELPPELSSLQSQDMSKIGFLQDLTDGIERCMRDTVKGDTAQKETHASSSGSASLERLLQNCQTYLKLNNYKSAEEVYIKVTKEYPEDHRGWWGLIVTKTQNFTKVLLDQSALNVWFGYVKQLAEPKDFSDLEKTYIKYTEKVAELAATEDIKAANAIIDGFNIKIHSLNQSISAANNDIDIQASKFDSQSKSDDSKILSHEKAISKNESNLSSLSRKSTIGTVLICLGILSYVLGMVLKISSLTGGFVLVLIGIGFRLSVKKLGNKIYIETIIVNESVYLEGAKSEKENNRIEYENNIAKLNQIIGGYNDDILVIQGEIQDCKKYLELGKEKIQSMWFAEKCAAFGVQQSCDSQVYEYRKAAFSVKSQAKTELVTINCPACRRKISVDRNQLASKGHVVCSACGTTSKVVS